MRQNPPRQRSCGQSWRVCLHSSSKVRSAPGSANRTCNLLPRPMRAMPERKNGAVQQSTCNTVCQNHLEREREIFHNWVIMFVERRMDRNNSAWDAQQEVTEAFISSFFVCKFLQTNARSFETQQEWKTCGRTVHV